MENRNDVKNNNDNALGKLETQLNTLVKKYNIIDIEFFCGSGSFKKTCCDDDDKKALNTYNDYQNFLCVKIHCVIPYVVFDNNDKYKILNQEEKNYAVIGYEYIDDSKDSYVRIPINVFHKNYINDYTFRNLLPIALYNAQNNDQYIFKQLEDFFDHLKNDSNDYKFSVFNYDTIDNESIKKYTCIDMKDNDTIDSIKAMHFAEKLFFIKFKEKDTKNRETKYKTCVESYTDVIQMPQNMTSLLENNGRMTHAIQKHFEQNSIEYCIMINIDCVIEKHNKDNPNTAIHDASLEESANLNHNYGSI